MRSMVEGAIGKNPTPPPPPPPFGGPPPPLPGGGSVRVELPGRPTLLRAPKACSWRPNEGALETMI